MVVITSTIRLSKKFTGRHTTDMIILDLQATLVAAALVHATPRKGIVAAPISEGLIRNTMLTSVLAIKNKFPKEFAEGGLTLALDSRSWRRDYFPHYKARRAVDRDKSIVDWVELMRIINLVRAELVEFFPYNAIAVQGAEADDIIAVLTQDHFSEMFGPRGVIVSGDKDFKQLHWANVSQWDHVNKKYIECHNPAEFLLEHIIEGDKGDGIPNALSGGDCFVTNTRQTPLTKERLDELKIFREKHPKFGAGFARNEKLIDLGRIPSEVVDAIRSAYEAEKMRVKPAKSGLIKYCMQRNLKTLVERISEF